jgi:hypothetical protein
MKKTNTGHWSTGNWSTGDHSTGNRSTGHWSTGNWSTGNWSTGNYSTGNGSTGHRSTGHRSTGHWSTGDWSTSNYSTGHFCTIDYMGFSAFNKPVEKQQWDNAVKPNFLFFKLTEWIYKSKMSDAEKQSNPSYETTGGYLKVYDYKEAFTRACENASDEEIEQLKALPNFDADVFLEISGYDVRKRDDSCNGKVVEIDGKKYKLMEVEK